MSEVYSKYDKFHDKYVKRLDLAHGLDDGREEAVEMVWKDVEKLVEKREKILTYESFMKRLGEEP